MELCEECGTTDKLIDISKKEMIELGYFGNYSLVSFLCKDCYGLLKGEDYDTHG